MFSSFNLHTQQNNDSFEGSPKYFDILVDYQSQLLENIVNNFIRTQLELNELRAIRLELW